MVHRCRGGSCLAGRAGAWRHGLREETGAAQHLRDVRITPIYEGTNGIQAITLLRRGLLRDQGVAVAELLDEIATNPALRTAADAARAAAAHLRTLDARAAEASAQPFLQALGTLTAGWLCARVDADAAAPPAARVAARVFLDHVLPRAAMFAAAVTAPAGSLAERGPIL